MLNIFSRHFFLPPAFCADLVVLPVFVLPSFVSVVHPLYHGILPDASIMLSPCHPEIGTKATVLGLYPTFLTYPSTSFLISVNRFSEYGGSVLSILLTPTIICLTPRVKASKACSLV